MKTTLQLLFLFFFSISHAQNFDYHPADWALFTDVDFKFKSPVKKVEATTYTMNENESPGEMWQKDILYFEDDKLTKWEQQDLQFGQSFSLVYNYFDNENKFKSRKIYEATGKLVEEAFYVYDSKYKDKVVEVKVKEYNSNMPEDSPMEFKIQIKLDKNGVREKDIYFDPNGNIRNEIVVGYTPAGLISSRKRFDKDGNWLMTDSIDYTSLLRKSKEISVYPNRDPSAENIAVTMTYSYNKAGYIDSMTIEDNLITFIYELDKQGHWIKRKSYITREGDKKAYQLVERKIDYGRW